MKNAVHDPLVNLILDEEEQALETALEQGEYQEVSQLEETQNMLREAAARYQELHTAKPITIRINQLDLITVKAKAKAHNIPYQTLLGVLIHQYAEGEMTLEL